MKKKRHLRLLDLRKPDSDLLINPIFEEGNNRELENFITGLHADYIKAEMPDDDDMGFDFLLDYDDDELELVVKSA